MYPNSQSLQKHFVILGWSERVRRIIKQLRNDEHAASGDLKPILVILPETVQTNQVEFERVYFVHGSVEDSEVLRRANVAAATAVLIPAHTNGPGPETNTNIFAFLSALSVGTEARICLEVRETRHAEILRDLQERGLLRTNIDIISMEAVSESLMAQAAISPGVARLVDELLAFDEATPEIYCCEVGSDWQGKTYRELRRSCAEHQITLLGYERGRKLSLNPEDLSFAFAAGDRVWFLALNRAAGLQHLAPEQLRS